jgi:hypothetical protein
MRLRHAGLSLVVVAVLALSAPAWAHVDIPSVSDFAPPPASVETLSAGVPSMDGLWLLVSAMAVAGVALARRRRAVALACTALLLLVAFEAGVHSVHHLADHLGTQCVVASASAHTGGVAVDAVAFEAPVTLAAPVAVTRTVAPVLRAVPPDLGRAPPSA